MFHQRCNELRLGLRLQPAAPLLIKAGEDPLDFLPPGTAAAAGNLPFAELVQQERDAIARQKNEVKERRERLKRDRQDGRKAKDKTELDMQFVRTRRNGQDEPYLPGSSLKGVLRSRCEQLAVTFGKKPICNIFDEEDGSGERSCTKRVEALSPGDRYTTACPICKLFG